MERIAVVMGKMHSGGKKNLVMEYYRNIDRSQIQFDFICDSDSNAIPYDEIEKLGGKVYIIPPYQKIFSNMRALKKICKKNSYKIMHSYNGTMNIFSMYIGWRCKIPIRINESISMGHKSDKKNILKNILKPFSKMFSTHFMANGEECGKWQFGNKLYEEGKIKIFKSIINTKVNAYNPELREKTRKEYNIDNNLVIGHIGRLTEQKNTLFLIDIFKEILKIEDEAKLLIIGDGNLKEKMLDKIEKYNIKNSVLYLGRREDIPQFYNAMDAFLLPSLYEGLPVVGIEAENCGLPMFFSKEIPQESSACKDLGFFIDLSEEPKKWAEIIVAETIKNINNRHGRENEITNAGFNSEEEGKKLVNYYNQLLKIIS